MVFQINSWSEPKEVLSSSTTITLRGLVCFGFLSGIIAFVPHRKRNFLQYYCSRSKVLAIRAASIKFWPDAREHSKLSTLFSQSSSPVGDNDPEDDEKLFFDDFNFVIGGDDDAAPPLTGSSKEPSPPAWKNKLDERIKETKEQEIYRDTKLVQAWKRGDWSVRGFSLDPRDALTEAAAENQDIVVDDNNNVAPLRESDPIIISKVVADLNSDGERIWVGRSNGSLFWVRLGNEYTTHFRSKLSGKFSSSQEDGNGSDDQTSSASATIGSELVREASQPNPAFPDGADDSPPLERPFSILAQFAPASSDASPISTILSVPDEDCVFTASKGSGQIQQWHISEDEIGSDSPTLKTPFPLSDGVHNDAIVALKAVNYKDAPLLLSVGAGGTLALWDLPSADLVYHCQISSEVLGDVETSSPTSDPTGLVHCADVKDNHIFLGTGAGYVLGYDVADLMNSASEGSPSCPLPRGKFNGHEGGVTAIACGGPGSLGRLSGHRGGAHQGTSSTVLLTGGGNGVVKQW